MSVTTPCFYRVRRPREDYPECVLVTSVNLAEVAAWAGGKVVNGAVEGTGSAFGPITVRATPGMMLCKRPLDFFLFARPRDEFDAEYVAVDADTGGAA